MKTRKMLRLAAPLVVALVSGCATCGPDCTYDHSGLFGGLRRYSYLHRNGADVNTSAMGLSAPPTRVITVTPVYVSPTSGTTVYTVR